MFLPSSVKIFMSDRPVDMRLGIDGLCAIIRRSWHADALSGHLFVFLGSRRDRAKILHWDSGGFVLYYKRLESGRFKSPKVCVDRKAIELDRTELFMMLDGIDFTQIKRRKRYVPKNLP
jgi:transposase